MGMGGRESIKRVIAAATRDQFKCWSKGKCRRVELPPERCLHGMERRWCRAAGQGDARYHTHTGGGISSCPFFSSPLKLISLRCLCTTRPWDLQAHHLLAEKQALGGLWDSCQHGGRRGDTGIWGGFVSPRTRCINPGPEEN